MKLESAFQHDLIDEIKKRWPGAIVLKNDPHYIQGFPDLSVFYRDRWAILECKRSAHEKHQPNQDYYVPLLNEMSFSAFIFPENCEEVLSALEEHFRN